MTTFSAGRLVLTIVFCFVMISTVFTSCSVKDTPIASEEETIPDMNPIDLTPTEDALTTKITAKAYVFEGEYGNIAKKMINRITNRQQELDSTTMLIVFPGDKYSTLSVSERKHIIMAYNKGAKIMVDRPSLNEMFQIAASTILEDSTSTVSDDTAPNDEKEEMWGFNSSEDVFHIDIPVKDSLDLSAYNRADLTGYEDGLFADEAAKWVNTDHAAVAMARIQEVSTRGYSDLKDVLDAQTDTWVASISTDRFGKIKDKQTPYTVFTSIYSVHKYENDTDYFLISQTLSGNNNTFWQSEWSEKDYKADFDSKKHDWRMQGFYANNWTLENRIVTGGWSDYLKLSDGLTLVKHAPYSTNASTTTSTSTSWSISGQLGTSGALQITGGISGSVGSSQTLMDITTVDKCSEGGTCNNNAWWQYTIDPWRQIKEHTFKYSFITPPDAAIHTFSCEQSWMWELKNASRYTKLRLRIDLNLELFRTLVRNPFIAYCGVENAHVWRYRMFDLKLPKHSK